VNLVADENDPTVEATGPKRSGGDRAGEPAPDDDERRAIHFARSGVLPCAHRSRTHTFAPATPADIDVAHQWRQKLILDQTDRRRRSTQAAGSHW
jgi:hypothetical protein